MNKVRLALVLITVAITVGPILGVVIAYRNNLLGLVVPPEMSQLINGPSGQTDNTDDAWSSLFSDNATTLNDFITPPDPDDIQYDPVSRTFTASFQMKDPLPYPPKVSLNVLSGNVLCDEHSFHLGTVSLKDPITMRPGETSTVTVVGQWTEEAVSHFQTAHAGEQSVKASLVDTTVNIGGVVVQISEPISLGEIPLIEG